MNKTLSNGIIVCVIILLVFWAVDIEWISPFISTPVVSDHKGIFPVAGIPILSNPPFIPQFPRYLDANSSLIPSWILSSPNENTIHRFFDTSPFSPSGRFVGVTQMRVKENRQVHVGDVAEILIYDLYTGVTRHISETTAWDSQVGSHVQWGLDDTELYFNSLPSHKEDSSDKPRGVVFNIFTNQTRTFDCPIYQISPNGLYSASPDLTSIRYTQLGYGIFTHGSHPSHNASKSNGLFLTDLSTGSCRLLVSLYDIAIFGDLPLDEPIYGFHVKWSSDNRMIMFVVRTLTSSVETSTGAKRVIKTARVNHLFTIDAVSGKILCHVVSWGSGCGSLNTQQYRTSAVSPTPSTSAPDSAPVSGGTLLLSEYQPSQSRVTSHIGGIAVRGDGNHPNWIPDSHKISLNYLSVCDYPEGRDKGQGQGQGIPVWKIAVFDVDEILSAEKSLGRRDGPKDTAPIERGQIAYGYGTGHPNYFPGGRFFVTDAYLKEKRMVGQGSIPPQQIRTGPVPSLPPLPSDFALLSSSHSPFYSLLFLLCSLLSSLRSQ
jgi:hypothetical protein